MTTQLFLNMQASIEKAEAKKYRYWTVARIEAKASNLKGIGYPISADALRLVRNET